PHQGKAEGLAACNSQTTSPFGCLNNFSTEILSNFLGALQYQRLGVYPFKSVAQQDHTILLFLCS
ncbi:hypothetical protein, partial [Negativibacillus massiliensis]|uniref:hypothetical protein n=1 Tax=Negativibacillus massiliensis TaxID=1871035 RepID=UPI003AF20CF5